MGSLAVLAKESGHHVTGSDINCYPPISDQLDEMGIDVIPNYDVDQLKLSPDLIVICLLYTSPSPRDLSTSRMPSSA